MGNGNIDASGGDSSDEGSEHERRSIRNQLLRRRLELLKQTQASVTHSLATSSSPPAHSGPPSLYQDFFASQNLTDSSQPRDTALLATETETEIEAFQSRDDIADFVRVEPPSFTFAAPQPASPDVLVELYSKKTFETTRDVAHIPGVSRRLLDLLRRNEKKPRYQRHKYDILGNPQEEGVDFIPRFDSIYMQKEKEEWTPAPFVSSKNVSKSQPIANHRISSGTETSNNFEYRPSHRIEDYRDRLDWENKGVKLHLVDQNTSLHSQSNTKERTFRNTVTKTISIDLSGDENVISQRSIQSNSFQASPLSLLPSSNTSISAAVSFREEYDSNAKRGNYGPNTTRRAAFFQPSRPLLKLLGLSSTVAEQVAQAENDASLPPVAFSSQQTRLNGIKNRQAEGNTSHQHIFPRVKTFMGVTLTGFDRPNNHDQSANNFQAQSKHRNSILTGKKEVRHKYGVIDMRPVSTIPSMRESLLSVLSTNLADKFKVTGTEGDDKTIEANTEEDFLPFKKTRPDEIASASALSLTNLTEKGIELATGATNIFTSLKVATPATAIKDQNDQGMGFGEKKKPAAFDLEAIKKQIRDRVSQFTNAQASSVQDNENIFLNETKTNNSIPHETVLTAILVPHDTNEKKSQSLGFIHPSRLGIVPQNTQTTPSLRKEVPVSSQSQSDSRNYNQPPSQLMESFIHPFSTSISLIQTQSEQTCTSSEIAKKPSFSSTSTPATPYVHPSRRSMVPTESSITTPSITSLKTTDLSLFQMEIGRNTKTEHYVSHTVLNSHRKSSHVKAQLESHEPANAYSFEEKNEKKMKGLARDTEKDMVLIDPGLLPLSSELSAQVQARVQDRVQKGRSYRQERHQTHGDEDSHLLSILADVASYRSGTGDVVGNSSSLSSTITSTIRNSFGEDLLDASMTRELDELQHLLALKKAKEDRHHASKKNKKEKKEKKERKDKKDTFKKDKKEKGDWEKNTRHTSKREGFDENFADESESENLKKISYSRSQERSQYQSSTSRTSSYSPNQNHQKSRRFRTRSSSPRSRSDSDHSDGQNSALRSVSHKKPKRENERDRRRSHNHIELVDIITISSESE